MLGDDGRRIRDRMRDQQVGARGRVRELLERLFELRHQQLVDDDLAALHGIHDALEEIARVRRVQIDRRAGFRELDAFALDLGAIAGGSSR